MSTTLADKQDTVVVTLEGRIALEEANALDAELRDLAARNPLPSQVVIDLSRLDYISSIGLGVLVAFRKTLRPTRVVLRNAQPLVRTLLQHANLHAIFTIVDTPAPAPARGSAGGVEAWLDDAAVRPVPVTA
jgi:anti-anti-sigma factor